MPLEATDTNNTSCKFDGVKLPPSWKISPHGHKQRYVYRLVDSTNGTDLRHPSINPEMVDKLRPGRGGVDFTDEAVKRQAMKHVHTNSERDVSQTPFLAASYDFKIVVALKALIVEHHKKLRQDYNPHIVMIDIVAAFCAGELTEKDMLDLSTDEAFDANLKSACSREFLEQYDIDYERTKARCTYFSQTLLRCRGPWWPDWAFLMNDSARPFMRASRRVRTIILCLGQN